MSDCAAETNEGRASGEPVAPRTTVIPFASHPDHDAADHGAQGIVAIRREAVNMDELDDVLLLSDDDASSLGPQPAIVIERARGKSSRLLVHVYAAHPAVVEYLQEATAPILREDAAILQFALAAPAAAASSSRAGASKREEASAAVRAENRMLRTALHLPAEGRITPSAVAASVAMFSTTASTASRPSTVPAAAGGGQLATSSGTSAPLPRKAGSDVPRSPSRPRSVTPGVLNDEADDTGKPPLHSPLQWDTVTESAVNARTKYDAYGRRKPSPSRLDTVTQQHLVQRLHDQSVDSKKRRLRQIEEQMLRSLGLQERRVLSSDEEHELGARLHDQQREYSKKVAAKLKEKYLPEIPKRALTPDVQKASAVRMHDETMERAKKNLAGLVAQYMPEPEHKKLDPEAQRAMADRLSQKH